MKTFAYILFSLVIALPFVAEAKTKEVPVVLLNYANVNEAGLCVRGECDDPNVTNIQTLQGVWFEKPEYIIPASLKRARKLEKTDARSAVVYDYSMQFYGRKQDVISAFVKKDHKRLWTLLEQTHFKNKNAVRAQKNIRLLGYAIHPKHEAYMFAFVTYEDAKGDTKKRTYVFTLEDGELKRTFSFAIDHKDIYRIVETAFRNGGDDFKVYAYERKGKEDKITGRIDDVYRMGVTKK